MRTLSLVVHSLLLIAGMSTTALSSAQERQMGGVGITVFADKNFRGKSATFRQEVPDLQRFKLNNKVSSLRVGPGELWEVCEHSNYQVRCVVVSGDQPDLKTNHWSDIISSLRPVGSGNISPGGPSQGDSYIVLFDQPNYRGNPTNFNAPVSSLSGSKRRVGSVTIGRGMWELCQGNHFTGRCVTLDQSVPDLSTYNLRNRVSSLRPVIRQPR
ncbi:MAG: beta/gamma crystallin family protein [Pyrinomonadaceae bacterium]|nr:beta/gamma crystallin family protein [Pyrinomonadaceae bacterium]